MSVLATDDFIFESDQHFSDCDTGQVKCSRGAGKQTVDALESGGQLEKN